MAGRLRADGIPAVVYPNDYTGYRVPGLPIGVFQVIVQRRRLEDARRVAAEYTTT